MSQVLFCIEPNNTICLMVFQYEICATKTAFLDSETGCMQIHASLCNVIQSKFLYKPRTIKIASVERERMTDRVKLTEIIQHRYPFNVSLAVSKRKLKFRRKVEYTPVINVIYNPKQGC